MNKDKVYQEKTARTIQPKRKNNGTLQLMDNRTAGIIQMMKDTPIQRIDSDEEDTLQGKFDNTIQCTENSNDNLQAKLIQRKPNNTGLPDHLKAGVENLSGFSMDGVKVHYNSSQPSTVQALAYTQGTDIHVAPGQEQHLPHEAWHVTQQMAGRVEPTTEVGGMPVNDNIGLEHEADVMGAKANSL